MAEGQMLKSNRQMGLIWMRVVTAACIALVALGTLASTRPAFGQGGKMGPRDVAEIPIESVPAWVSEGVAKDIPEEGRGGIEVLAVLRDPRDVPIDRFLYALTERGEVMVHPEADAIRRSFEAQTHSAVAVYVRVTARAEICEDCYEGDPFFVDPLEEIERYPGSAGVPWDAIGVAYEADGVSVLPCLEPMTIEKGVRSFTAPDTGTRVQPDQYLPPMPQYVVRDNTNTGLLQGEMTAGEVREGWILCLAPDVPGEEVKVVTGPIFSADHGTFGYGNPKWAHVEEMAIGEWYLLENRQVLGWNEDPAEVRGGDPTHLDEEVVYEGDVWVSVGQALRHLGNLRVDQNGISSETFEEEIRLQMYFEGMDELLTRWDQLGLQGGMDVSIIGDLQHPWKNGAGGQVVELRARGTSRSVGSSSLIVGEGRHREPQEVLWLYPGDIRTLGGTGPIQVWRIEFQEIEERELTTDAICAETECVVVPVGPQGREVNTPLPLIPAGTRAFGLMVQSARFVQPPILHAGGLDVFLDEGSNRIYPGRYKFLVVDVEMEGGNSGVVFRRLTDDGGIESPGSSWSIFPERYALGEASGYVTLGGKWLSFARSARTGTVLSDEVPSGWILGDTVLMRFRGPVWELP
jgi:hypothetical protein